MFPVDYSQYALCKNKDLNKAYPQQSLKAIASNETAVNALIYGTTHANGSEVIEVKVLNVTAGFAIVEVN